MPAIHVQLVMQRLTGPELLPFARTCRALRALAADTFSSRHASIRLRYSHLMQCPTPTGAITKQMQTTLVWDSGELRIAESDFETLLHYVQHLRVFAFAMPFARRIKPRQTATMLRHPAFKELRMVAMHSINLPGTIDASILAALAALPFLHTLSVAPLPSPSDAWKALAAFPSLTTLYICREVESPGRKPTFPCLASCSQLTQLSLRGPSCCRDFLRLCAGLSNLRSLTLLQHQGMLFSVDDPRACFAAMGCLEVLEFVECGFLIASLLSPMQAASALRQLIVQPGALNHGSKPNLAVWSQVGIDGLSALLEARLQLRCVVRLDETASNVVQTMWKAIAMRSAHNPRVSVEQTSVVPSGLLEL